MPAPELAEQYSSFERQEESLRHGMWLFLASELMLFAALFASYGGYRAMYAADFARAIKHNTLVFGTVNAGFDAFRAAVEDLARFHRRWPLPLRALITGRHPPEAAIDLLTRPAAGFKAVVSFAELG